MPLKNIRILIHLLMPKINKLIFKKYFHIGFAVDTPHGLMVPKIRNVDQWV